MLLITILVPPYIMLLIIYIYDDDAFMKSQAKLRRTARADFVNVAGRASDTRRYHESMPRRSFSTRREQRRTPRRAILDAS